MRAMISLSAGKNKNSRRHGKICGIFMLSIKNYFKREQGQR